MVKKWLQNSLISLLLPLTSAPLLAQEQKPSIINSNSEQQPLKKKVPYSAIGVFGADTTLGSPDGWTVPIARVIGYQELNKLDLLAQADTLGLSLQADYRTNPGIGIKPHYDYIAHGDYRHFNSTGNRLPNQEVKASVAGIDIFTTASYDKLIGKITFGSGYKWYAPQTATTISTPKSHQVQDLIVDLIYQNSTTKDMVIKDGIEASLQLGLQSHGTITLTKRAYGMAGWYHNFSQDKNLKLEARVGIEQGSDTQNAWYLGSFISKQAPIPGRGYMQFRQSSFAQAQASFGFPLISTFRAEPSASIVIFPIENNINGAPQSDLIHPSLSLTLTGKIAGILPIGLKYGYALPTSQLSDSHELFIYTMLAYNKL